MKCNSCQLVAINGIPVHEPGCPNSDIDPATGTYYLRECEWCGQEFIPETAFNTCCDESCAEAFYGF